MTAGADQPGAAAVSAVSAVTGRGVAAGTAVTAVTESGRLSASPGRPAGPPSSPLVTVLDALTAPACPTGTTGPATLPKRSKAWRDDGSTKRRFHRSAGARKAENPSSYANALRVSVPSVGFEPTLEGFRSQWSYGTGDKEGGKDITFGAGRLDRDSCSRSWSHRVLGDQGQRGLNQKQSRHDQRAESRKPPSSIPCSARFVGHKTLHLRNGIVRLDSHTH